MGFVRQLFRVLFFWRRTSASPAETTNGFTPSKNEPPTDTATNGALKPAPKRAKKRRAGKDVLARPIRLTPLRYQTSLVPTPTEQEAIAKDKSPYTFAPASPLGGWLDLSQDGDPRWLDHFDLPLLKTPRDLADWLHIPVGKLSWLTNRFADKRRPPTAREAHYHFHWLRKRSGGHRLIEAPKPLLMQVQQQILRQILDHVQPHPEAHGFVAGRSIRTNAEPHVGKYLILKFDLENFYPNVRYARVVAIFRSLGYTRDVALWLARLTTSAVPLNLPFPDGNTRALDPYYPPHLPQGACTSPALANLSAYGLDVRLSGLAKAYHAQYSRYADDLTISGSHRFAGALREFITLAEKIIRQERFRVNRAKRRVVRQSKRQIVTGIVVNETMNCPRPEFDRLKAILHNCLRHGPQDQNRAGIENFAAHLRGRIAHVRQLNPARGDKLLRIFEQIPWNAPT